MNTLVLLAFAAAQAVSGAPLSSRAPTGTLCLDLVGENHGPVCHSFSASRIDPAPDICECLNGQLQVAAPYCAPDEVPQVPTHEFKLARHAAALRAGTLVGQSYSGRSYCIAQPFSRAP